MRFNYTGYLLSVIAVSISAISATATAQDVDFSPPWVDPLPVGGEVEIGSLTANGGYQVTFGANDGRQVQGAYEILRYVKSQNAFVRVARDFGGAANRSKLRISSLTAVPAATGTNSPAFGMNWSAIGTAVFEFHLRSSNTFSVGDGNLVASTVAGYTSTAHVTTLSITFDFNSTTRILTVRTRDVTAIKDGPTTFDGSYHVTGKTSSRNVVETREIGGGFVDNLLSLSTAKEVTKGSSLIRTRIGPFPYSVDAGAVRIFRARFSDGRVCLRLALNSSWFTDVSGSANQYAAVLTGSCTTGLKWKADVSRRDKSGSLSWSKFGECSTTKSTLPVLTTWNAPAARSSSVMNLAVEVRPNLTGKGSMSMVYSSTLGGCRMYAQADTYVLDQTVAVQGAIKSGNFIALEF